MFAKLKYLALGAVALGAMSLSGAASAETTLTLSSWLPPKHPIVEHMIEPWIAEVEKATNGNVKIKILPKAMGKPPAHFDIAKDGLADISYGVHGYQPGRFLMTKAVEMPFLGDSATASSVAYWRIYKKYLEKFDEHKGTVVLGVFTHGPGEMFNAVRPVNQLSDLDGLKIRVGGGVVNDVTQALGVTSLLKPASKSYELMSNGVADGVFFPKESIASFKLSKLVRYATFVPGGLYNTSFFLVMNPASFNKLSKEDQDAIMKVSGENFARIAGKGWDDADKAGVATMEADGVEITTASDDFVAAIKAKTDPIEAAWIAEVTEKGLDGAKVMADLRAEIAKVEAEQ
ncbi:TRAP transporter substrate-binding protein [Roseibium aggregatum]|uniref:TRAP transporter substrate-binding protein n=1 Tax=Roseibium aggregatum TaxID=187304 RepID=A0A926S7B7_9HYPH|nr:TRAP transporter substrate-binding protein [Roseibium aggregatum]MBD1548110.1 TRAP transporter substrate-binding protein [Roseibium aggregatum]